MGGYITGILGILIFPWKLMADPNGYIFKWLIAYSSLLGPIGGILIADYFFIRRQKLVAEELYRGNGIYSFDKGYNRRAIGALILGILPNIPGFLLEVRLISSTAFPGWISELYHYAWFVGFFVSGIIYLLLMRNKELPDAVTYQREKQYVTTH
jgi:NCS1 family nucleobase:cation symporter-1